MCKIFIAGCGDIGLRVARLCRDQGWPVTGLVRSVASGQRLREADVTPWVADLDDRDAMAALPVAGARVFYFAPPPTGGVSDPRLVNFLAALGAAPQRLVYLGTSGVYGDRGGAWVDETTSPHPQTDRARRRLHAETTVREWGRRHGVPVVVLRVGGIYGPGRLPVARLRRGEPILDPAACGYTNRIHADDLARVCLAAAERGAADGIYNVSDGHSGTMSEYFLAVAERLGLPRPPIVGWDEAQRVLGTGMLSYLRESRRMDNRRMLEELGVELRYPTLEAGLAAIDPERERTAG